MARRKKMRGKGEKEEGERAKREERGENIGDQIEKNVNAHNFPLRCRHFFFDQSEIRYSE